MFKDRSEAGKRLVPLLKEYQNHPDAIVLGLPRGGVVVAYEVAKELHLPLDIICPRKVGAPFNPELAIGAITETGEGILDEHLIAYLSVPQKYIQETIEKEKKKAQERLQLYRKSRPKISLSGKIAILTDDGLATGATMRAAIKSVRAEGAKKIVVAVPVAPPDTFRQIQREADAAICLDTPISFAAVGQFYANFSQIEDDEVVKLLQEKTAEEKL